MISRLFAPLLALFLSLGAVHATTFNYDVIITDISGEGQGDNLGFFSTGSIGDFGTGSARTDFLFPTTTPMQLADNSLFGVSFPGTATAASFFANPVVHDPVAGTVTVSGGLGGLTGPYPEFISASAFEFVYTGTPGAIASLNDYETFLSGASMSGFVSAFFFPLDDPEVGKLQRIDFVGVSEIPLPAGAVLLLSGLGLLALRRKRS